MQITRQADYALRAVLYLTRLDGSERAATGSTIILNPGYVLFSGPRPGGNT